ncbi:hypothetical protein BGZ94_006790, partial [Podila epigama]
MGGIGAFRPEYGLLGQLRRHAPRTPIVGVTAALDSDELVEIKRSLFRYRNDTPLKFVRVVELRKNLDLE